jgi:MFS family permease
MDGAGGEKTSGAKAAGPDLVGWAAWLAARLPFFRDRPSDSLAFRILLLGTSVSMLGSRISTVAFPMLVLQLYHSPFITGLVTFASVSPSMIAYIPAGALVDRWNPRVVMIVSEICRGVAIAAVFCSLSFGSLLHWSKPASLAFLIAMMIAEELFEVFSALAERRYMSRLMEESNRANRQASIEVRTHAVVLAGRPAGPFLFSLSSYYPFLADAFSFVASTLSLLVVKRGQGNEQAPERPVWQLAGEIKQGAALLLKDSRARLSMFLMAITSLVAQAFILMVLSEAHAKSWPSVSIGLALAASGVGGALGGIISRKLPAGVKDCWLPIQMLSCMLVFSVLMHTGSLSVVYCGIAMFIFGLTGAVGNIAFGTYLVAEIPDNMIAKVTSLGQVVAIGACGLGPVVGGFLIQDLPLRGAAAILVLIMLLSAVISFRAPHAGPGIEHFLRAAARTAAHAGGKFVSCGIARAYLVSPAKKARRHGGNQREVFAEDLPVLVGSEIVDYSRLFTLAP